MTAEKIDKFLQYGINVELAEKAISAGLSVSKIRTLSQSNMGKNFGLSRDESKELSALIKRTPIDPEVLNTLLENSNYVCNVCKGVKSKSYVVHHIEPYEVSQNNSYDNLIVVCPTDHDLAHQGGLSLKITPKQLKRLKLNWEKEVQISNVQTAARAINVVDGAIDYINVKRIEELCMNLFTSIPQTSYTDRLKHAGVLNKHGVFDQKNVIQNISNGRYLFDYMNHGEALHYKALLESIATRVLFEDLDQEAEKGFLALKNLEGKNAFFIGGVHAKGPDLPINNLTPPIRMHYKRKNLRFEWILDAQYLYSMSAIARIGGTNRYIIYCLVRTVTQNDSREILIQASPYLIAQPTAYVHKKPAIAYIREYEEYIEDGLVDER